MHSLAVALSELRLWVVRRLKRFPRFYRTFRSACFGGTAFVARLINAIVDRVKFIAGNFEASHRKFICDHADERLRDFSHLKEDGVAIDGGGYMGDWTASVIEKCNLQVIVYEPVPEFFHRSVDRFSSNPNVEVRPIGLGAKNGARQFAIAGNASGMFEASDAPVNLPVADVHEEFSRFERIDLLKLNIEGGEYEVLERLLDTRAISKVVRLQVQFHLNVPQAAKRYGRIRRRLKLTHKLMWRYPFVWEEWQLRQTCR
jgi:FkbM family methyltransferase